MLEEEIYVDYLEKKYNRKVKSLSVEPDGDFVNLRYTFEPVPFNRIRRITGYLTGDVTTWNDAKRAELDDRVSHGMGSLERI